MSDKLHGSFAERSQARPVCPIPSPRGAKQGVSKRLVPFAGPSAHHKAVFIEDAIEQPVDFRVVGAEFIDCVLEIRGKVVAVQLDHGAARVSERCSPCSR